MPTFMTVGGDPVIMGGEVRLLQLCLQVPPALLGGGEAAVLLPQKPRRSKTVGLLTATDGFGKDGAPVARETGTGLWSGGSWPGNPSAPRTPTSPLSSPKIKNAKPQAIICLDHRPGRRHRLQEQGAAWHHRHSPVPVPWPAGPKIHRTGRQGRGRGPDALHQAPGRWTNLADTDPQKPVIKEFIRLYTDVYHFDKQFPDEHPLGLRLGCHHDCGQRHEEGGHRPGQARRMPSNRPRATWGSRGSITSRRKTTMAWWKTPWSSWK